MDARGDPLNVHLTAGQRSELHGADALLGTIQARVVIADTGFDADKRVRQPLAEAGKEAVIRARRNRIKPLPLNQEIYKLRHKIENCIAHLKQFRSLATRYDKTQVSFLAAVHWACALRWLVR